MAHAHLAYGNLSQKHAILTTDFRSTELNGGSNFTFTGVNLNYLTVAATVDIFVAFTSNGTVPNTAADPRVRIPAGSFMAFAIRDGVRIAVATA